MKQNHEILSAYESAEPCSRLHLYLAYPTLRDQFIDADIKDSFSSYDITTRKYTKNDNMGWLDRLFRNCPHACDFQHSQG